MSRLALPGLNPQSSRLLWFNALFSLALFGIVDVLLNFYFVSLGHSDETIGILQSLPRVGGLIAAVLVMPMTTRWSARRVLIGTTIGMAVAQSMTVLVPTAPVIALSRAALGLFFGVQQIAISPVAAALTSPEHQTRIFAYINTSSNVAGALGGLVGGLMPAWIAFLLPALAVSGDLPAAQTPFAYGLAIFVASIITALAVIPIWRLALPEVAVSAGVRSAVDRVPWRKLLPRSLPMLFFGATGGLTFPFYNLFFRETFDSPDAVVGAVLSFGFFVMGLPVLFSPQLERRFGRRGALLVATGVASVAFIGLGLSTSLGAAVVFFVVAASLRSITNAIYPPMMIDGLQPQFHNAAFTVSYLAWNIGWLAATSLGGFMIARLGYSTVLVVVAAGTALIGVSAWSVFGWDAAHTVAAPPLETGGAVPIAPSEP